MHKDLNFRRSPDELVYKKCIVDLIMALNMLLCKFSEVFVKNEDNAAHLMKMTANTEKFRTA